MGKLFNTASVCGGIVGGGISFILGGWDSLAKILICFMVLDYLTGVLAAIYNKKLQSGRGFKGIIKKTCILLAVCVSALMQVYLKFPVRDIVVTFFVVNEGISLLENLGQVITLPEIIRKSLESLNGEEHENR